MSKATSYIALFALTYLLAHALLATVALENRECVQGMGCTNVCSHGGICSKSGKCVCLLPNAVINSGPPCSSDEVCVSMCGNGSYCIYEIGQCNCK
ncbi:PREDICTED: putative defensin-like protein 282 [Camelina sativa]|uniref:Defensin-like protein 282 n=1 Tax=Camelina sativa TaxID=90675 RepID=A0ABM1QZY8_CAMSA|nr:PREDICTED: putative defensin-like protein 282 [Camelina sativa]